MTDQSEQGNGRYEVTGINFTRRRGKGASYLVPVGTIIIPTDSELRSFSDKLRKVADDDLTGETLEDSQDHTPPTQTGVDTPTGASNGDLTAVPGIGVELCEALAQIGINTVDDLRQASDQTLLDVPGIGKKKLEAIREVID